MNWQEFFKTDEFKAYRQSELKAGIGVVDDLLKGSQSKEYVNGAMKMLNAILLVPKGLATTKKASEDAERIVATDFVTLKTDLLKKALREE